MPPRRRYPAPWRVVESTESYVIEDDNGQHLAFVYFENEPQRQMSMKRIGKGDVIRRADLDALWASL